ncbi:MAG: hypothetical protein WA137_10820, partial [Methanothrix sp.]
MCWWSSSQAILLVCLFFAMEEELSQIIGRKVDLNTSGFLSPYFRDRIERDSDCERLSILSAAFSPAGPAGRATEAPSL